MRDAIDSLVRLVKGEGGWGNIPKGTKGGQRKRVGNKWRYRYPDGKGGWQSRPGKGGKGGKAAAGGGKLKSGRTVAEAAKRMSNAQLQAMINTIQSAIQSAEQGDLPAAAADSYRKRLSALEAEQKSRKSKGKTPAPGDTTKLEIQQTEKRIYELEEEFRAATTDRDRNSAAMMLKMTIKGAEERFGEKHPVVPPSIRNLLDHYDQEQAKNAGADKAWGGRNLGKPDTIHMKHGGTRYKYDHGIFIETMADDGLFHVSQAGNPTKSLGSASSLAEAKKLALRNADFADPTAARSEGEKTGKNDPIEYDIVNHVMEDDALVTMNNLLRLGRGVSDPVDRRIAYALYDEYRTQKKKGAGPFKKFHQTTRDWGTYAIDEIVAKHGARAEKNPKALLAEALTANYTGDARYRHEREAVLEALSTFSDELLDDKLAEVTELQQDLQVKVKQKGQHYLQRALIRQDRIVHMVEQAKGMRGGASDKHNQKPKALHVDERKRWEAGLRRNVKNKIAGGDGGRVKAGRKVSLNGKDWRVYDFDADASAPEGTTLVLFDGQNMMSGVRLDNPNLRYGKHEKGDKKDDLSGVFSEDKYQEEMGRKEPSGKGEGQHTIRGHKVRIKKDKAGRYIGEGWVKGKGWGSLMFVNADSASEALVQANRAVESKIARDKTRAAEQKANAETRKQRYQRDAANRKRAADTDLKDTAKKRTKTSGGMKAADPLEAWRKKKAELDAKKSADAIEGLEELSKGPHKYKSRKRVGKRWVYDYGDKAKAKGKKYTGDFGIEGLNKDRRDFVGNLEALNALLEDGSKKKGWEHATVEGVAGSISGLNAAISNKLGSKIEQLAKVDTPEAREQSKRATAMREQFRGEAASAVERATSVPPTNGSQLDKLATNDAGWVSASTGRAIKETLSKLAEDHADLLPEGVRSRGLLTTAWGTNGARIGGIDFPVEGHGMSIGIAGRTAQENEEAPGGHKGISGFEATVTTWDKKGNRIVDKIHSESLVNVLTGAQARFRANAQRAKATKKSGDAIAGLEGLSKARYYDMDYGSGKMTAKKESASMGKSKGDIIQKLIAKMKAGDITQELIGKMKAAGVADDVVQQLIGRCNTRKARKSHFEPSLKKGLYAFELSGPESKGRKLSDNLLPQYLGAFVEQAYEHEKQECEHVKNKPTGYDDQLNFFAMRIMNELVVYMRNNPDLMAAGKDATAVSIANILRNSGLIQPDVSGFDNDAGNGYRGEVAHYSKEAPWIQEDPGARPSAQLADHHEQGSFIDDTEDPSIALRKSQVAETRRAFTAPEPEFVVKGDGDCPVHGYHDLTKMQTLLIPPGHCTCN